MDAPLCLINPTNGLIVLATRLIHEAADLINAVAGHIDQAPGLIEQAA